MQLEDYFDFEEFEAEGVGKIDRIRLKGTRIAIEHVIEPFLQGESPERIYQGYRHSLQLEHVYATITYYFHNKIIVDDYLRRGNQVADHFYQEHLKKEPSELTTRLRALKAQKAAQAES